MDPPEHIKLVRLTLLRVNKIFPIDKTKFSPKDFHEFYSDIQTYDDFH
jgi:hypothetical protein